MSPRPATPAASPPAAVVSPAAVALNHAADGRAPDWIQLLPRGDELRGRDGRCWLNDLPAVLAAFAAHGQPIAVDYEHAQDLVAAAGQEAPAAAWITEMEDRGGELWGRAEWTPRGARTVKAREYRFFSPAFSFDPATARVTAIVGGGLVNRPNFVMAALNRTGDPSMKQIATALGLAETATEGECVMALAAHRADHATALSRAGQPDLTRFVPKADLTAALNRASAAETELSTIKATGQANSAAAAVDAAIAAGKVAPASREFYIGTCATAQGLTAFNAHVASLPSLFKASGLDGRNSESGDVARATGGPAMALSAEQQAAGRALGIPDDQFAAWLAERAAKGTA